MLTLRLDTRSQAFFEEMRRRYYPPHLNRIPAHLTLFHTLRESGATRAALAEIARGQRAFELRVTGLRSLGRGVAYRLASDAAQRLHGALADAFAEELSAQDRQRFDAHVVVMNKSTGEAARALLATLTAEFMPFTVQAEGLTLWRYLGGPWELMEEFGFA